MTDRLSPTRPITHSVDSPGSPAFGIRMGNYQALTRDKNTVGALSNQIKSMAGESLPIIRVNNSDLQRINYPEAAIAERGAFGGGRTQFRAKSR